MRAIVVALNDRGIPTASGRGEWQAGFLSLGDAWADTTAAHRRLILTVLGGLARPNGGRGLRRRPRGGLFYLVHDLIDRR
jgi:hypothetical protein